MARTGRPPKSVEQHRNDDTPAKSTTPLVIGGRQKPEPSAHLDAESKAFFDILVDDLWDAGILDAADRGMIELAAIEQAVIAACSRDIAERGIFVKVKRAGYNGSKARVLVEGNPAVAMREKAMMHSRQLLDLLGIGPSARARLAGQGVKGKPPSAAIKGLGTARKLRVVAGGKAKSA